MFPSNGTASPNGVTRIGPTVVATHTVVIGEREYIAYVWGKRMPRTNEMLVRQAARDLDDQRAQAGEPSTLYQLMGFFRQVRDLVAQTDEGMLAELAVRKLKSLVDDFHAAADLPQAPLPEWHAYLNRVACGLVEGLSPLQADLLEFPEIAQVLEACHYPGFWKDRESLPNAETAPTTTPTMEMTTNPIGSTSKPEFPPSAASASPSSEP